MKNIDITGTIAPSVVSSGEPYESIVNLKNLRYFPLPYRYKWEVIHSDGTKETVSSKPSYIGYKKEKDVKVKTTSKDAGIEHHVFTLTSIFMDQETISWDVVVSEGPPPDRGILSIDTTPVKGEVFVDGVSWGVAPQNREMNPGTYFVEFGEVD